MSILSESISARLHRVDSLIETLEKNADSSPDGHLRISCRASGCRYYHVQKNGLQTYLSKDKKNIAAALAQKDYERKVLTLLRKERSLLYRLYSLYSNDKITGAAEDLLKDHFFDGPEERIWRSYQESRRLLVTPVCLDDEAFVLKWMSEQYEPKGFSENAPEFYTSKNIRVRSKTELIIAEKLDKYGIPYYYEKPLFVRGMGIIHPDFTVLNVRQRKVKYWEHLGMMDDTEYRMHALNRINRYENAGFFPGIDLILTHETSASPIRTNIIEKCIEKYLL